MTPTQLAGTTLRVVEDPTIRRHEIANRLTNVERRLLTYLSRHQTLITCVGNIGAGKSSLVKLLAYSTGMNALFELPDDGFEDHIAQNPSLFPLLATAKHSAKRTLGRYYGAINTFIDVQGREARGSASWVSANSLTSPLPRDTAAPSSDWHCACETPRTSPSFPRRAPCSPLSASATNHNRWRMCGAPMPAAHKFAAATA